MNTEAIMRFLNIENCEPGMLVGQDIRSPKGLILLRAGNTLKPQYLQNLKTYGYKGIYIEDTASKGINTRDLVPQSLRNEATELVENLYGNMKTTDTRSFRNLMTSLETVLDDVIDSVMRNRETTVNLQTLKTYDQYTFQHSVDVAVLSMLIGKELKLKRGQLLTLGTSAIFHDIGKTAIPLSILNKPAKLTDSEFTEMKKHTEYGYAILKDKMGIPDEIALGALLHHERYDGRGYPTGRGGEDLPLYSRIMAVADVYDAMTSKRVYRKAMLPSDVYEYIMSNGGQHFDPVVTKAFLGRVAPFPVGTSVILSNGQKGIVVENDENFMMRPTLRIYDESMELAPDEEIEPTVVNLATELLNVTIVEVL